MLQPKRTKFRKAHKGRIHGVASSGATLSFGQFGLKAMEPERVTARQIEAARRALTRHMKRAGRVWIRVFPDVPVSKKPAEVRQGKGKGSIEYWAARVKPGRILFELDGVPGPLAAVAFQRAAMKLPIKTKVVARLGDTSHLGAE
jgi:large subunit ribosomal protein L16